LRAARICWRDTPRLSAVAVSPKLSADRDQRPSQRGPGWLAASHCGPYLLLDRHCHLGDLGLACLPNPVDLVLRGRQVGTTLEVVGDQRVAAAVPLAQLGERSFQGRSDLG
jgi:hypothetical protein